MKTLIFFFSILALTLLFHPQPVSAHVEKSYAIQMNDKGASPTSIEITQGDTIVFENTGTSPIWPASDMHPTHQIFPEFDPKKAVSPAKSWSFRFDKSGTWKFHDHLHPAVVGTITVRKDSHRPDEERKKESISPHRKMQIAYTKIYYGILPEKQEQFLRTINVHDLAEKNNQKDEEQIQYLLSVFGPTTLMADLLADTGQGFTVDCHQAAHKLGRFSYEIYAASVFKDGSAACHSGFYHGAMEAFINDKGVDNLPSDISSVCNNFDTRFGNFECFHGVGHGLLAFVNYDLPEAIKLCGQLGNNQNACYGGMFMENIMVAQGWGAIPDHKTKWLSSDPHFPCNSIQYEPGIQYECYQMQTSWMRTLFNENAEKIIAECSKAPDQQISVCYRSWGRDIASFTLRNPEKIASGCSAVPNVENYIRECISGGLNVIIDFWGNNLTNQGSDLCNRLSETHKQLCYENLAWRLPGLFSKTTDYAKVCTHFEPKYQYLCNKS